MRYSLWSYFDRCTSVLPSDGRVFRRRYTAFRSNHGETHVRNTRCQGTVWFYTYAHSTCHQIQGRLISLNPDFVLGHSHRDCFPSCIYFFSAHSFMWPVCLHIPLLKFWLVSLLRVWPVRLLKMVQICFKFCTFIQPPNNTLQIHISWLFYLSIFLLGSYTIVSHVIAA